LELLLVIALLALTVGLVSVSLRDSNASRLDEEAGRLSALLESARAQSRVTGATVRWLPVAGNGQAPASFRFDGLSPENPLPDHWLDDRTSAEVVGAASLLLGPEPVIGAQRVVLHLDDRQLVLGTDGLGPFEPVADASGSTPAVASR
jgi:general secretion pathway protein H